MPEPIHIRRATVEDAATLVSLVDALADYERLDRPNPEAHERLIRDGFGPDPIYEAYLAELDGRAVGYAITFRHYSSFLARPTLFLEDVYVLPEARRHGVGTAFFRFLAAEAVSRGYGRMEWMVLAWNQLAIDFYDKMGAWRLSDWHVYRLTREQLEEMAHLGPGE